MYERDSEILSEAMQAVYAGDVAAAEVKLDLLRTAAHSESLRDMVAQAKRSARPLPPAPNLPEPEVLPRPGHLPGSYEGSPNLAQEAAA